MELNEIYQEYLDMDNDTRNVITKECVTSIYDYLKDNYGQTSAFHSLTNMFSVFGCIDGGISEVEYELFVFSTGIECTYDNFYEATKNGTSECNIENLMDDLEDEEEDFILDVFMLAILIFTSNGTLTVEEQEFIEKFFL